MGYSTAPGAIIRIGVDGADSARREMESVSATFDKIASSAANVAKSLAATLGIGAGISAVIGMTDQYAKFNAQLNLASTSAAAFAQSQADVRRIATAAQSDLAGTGVLYARIANGTRELGIAQSRVADITETVNLALKVSGATAAEAASAQLQLSQAFASGTLRGEEFNAVNEAAPRLMLALAEGIGVPVGALKQMASDGKITSQVMAEVLPRALEKLRGEASEVQTISGAMTVLKDRVMEFVGMEAKSSGAVSALATGISAVANNLQIVAGAAMTVSAVKLGNWLNEGITRSAQAVASNRTLAASTLQTAQANATATAQASLLAGARVAELRSATLAAAGETQLAIATNGLIPAQARAAAAAQAHAVAMGELAVAQRASSIAATAASTAIAALGGPIGAVITVLGIAATAWSWYSSKEDEANRKASESTEQSTGEIVANLEKQNAKLRERIALSKQAGLGGVAQGGGEGAERLASLLVRINELKAKGSAITATEQIDLIDLRKSYGDLANSLTANNALKADLEANGKSLNSLMAIRERLTGVNHQYVEDLTALEAARAANEIGQEEYLSLLRQLATQTYESSTAGKEAEKQNKSNASAYQSLASAVRQKIDAGKLEMNGYEKLSESQKLTIKLNEDIAAGKIAGGSAQAQAITRLIAERKAIEDVLGSQRRAAEGAEEWEKISKQQIDATSRSINSAAAEAEKNEDLARTFGMTTLQIERLSLARMEEKFAQRAATAMTLDEVQALEQLIEAKKRSVAALTQLDGLESVKQAREDEKRATESLFKSIDQTAHDTFVSIFDSGKSAFDRLRDTLKNGLLDLLYQMTVKKWIFNIGTSISGSGGDASAMSGFASAGGSGGVMNAASLISMGKTIYSGFSSGLGSGLGSMVSSVGNMFGSANVSAFGTGMGLSGSQASTAASAYNSAGMTGTGSALSSGSSFGSAASTAGWIAVGMALSNNMFNKGWDPNNGSLQKTAYMQPLMVGESLAWNKLFRGLGMGDQAASIFSGASLTSRLFGRKNPEITEQGVQGSFGAGGFVGNGYANVLEKGGVFRSDKRYQRTADLDASTDLYLDGAIKNLLASVKGFGDVLGLPVAQIDGYTKAIKLTLTADDAKNQEAITKMFGGIGDDLAELLLPTISQFAKAADEFGGAGETASVTLQRIVTDYTVLDAAFESIGRSFGAVGVASIAARERLVDLSGGMDSFGKSAAFFAQNYLSDAERLAPVAKSVEAALASLGLSGITTRDQFKDVVLGLDLTSASGASTYVSLMKVEEAFAQVHPAAEAAAAAARSLADIANERAAIDKKIFDMTHTAAEILTRDRDLELAALDESNRALMQRYYGLQDEATASALAADAIQKASDTAAAAAKAHSDGLQSLGNAFAESMNKAREAAQSLRDFNQSLLLGNLSALSPEQQYLEAKRQRDTASAEDLPAATTAFLEASRNWFGSGAGYASDFTLSRMGLEGMAASKDAEADSIPAFWKMVQEMMAPNGSHANGLDYVPFNGYRAILHEGERVQTAASVRASDAVSAESTRLQREILTELQAANRQRGAVGTVSIEQAEQLEKQIAAMRRELARASAA